MPSTADVIPIGQAWLLDLLQQSLNLPKQGNGTCFGIAYLGMRAIISKQIDAFDKHLNETYIITDKALADSARKCISLVNQIKHQTWLKYFPTIKAFDIAQLSDEQKHNFEKQWNLTLINECKQKPNLHVIIFLHSLFRTQEFNRLVSKTESKQSEFQEISRIISRLYSTPAGKKDIIELDNFSDIYTLSELKIHFANLESVCLLSSVTEEIVSILISSNHAITVSYNPRNRQWSFIDANQLPTKYFTSADTIATQVNSAFSSNDITVFSSHIFISKEAKKIQEKEYDKFIKLWIERTKLNDFKTLTEKIQLKDSYDASLLIVASRNGEYELVKFLLENESDVNQANNLGYTPLISAVARKHATITELLLSSGANVNHCDIEKRSPLLLAICNKDEKIVELLLAAGADPSQVDKENHNPIYISAQNGYLNIVKLLLKYGANPAQASYENFTPLFIAAQIGHAEIVEVLLAAKADVNQICRDNTSPLAIAVQGGHENVVKLLLAAGANPNQANIQQITPLFVAAINGYASIVALILNAGADPNQINCYQHTPYYIAAENGHVEVLKVLLADSRVNIDQTCDGATALFVAAQYGKKEVVNYLLSQHADFTITVTRKLDDILHFAKAMNIEDPIKQAIKRKKLSDAQTDFEFSPLEIAKIMGHIEIVQLLLAESIKNIDDYLIIVKKTSLSRKTIFSYLKQMDHFSKIGITISELLTKFKQKEFYELCEKFITDHTFLNIINTPGDFIQILDKIDKKYYRQLFELLEVKILSFSYNKHQILQVLQVSNNEMQEKFSPVVEAYNEEFKALYLNNRSGPLSFFKSNFIKDLTGTPIERFRDIEKHAQSNNKSRTAMITRDISTITANRR